MATGRTLNRWTEPLINGYAIFNDTRQVGPLSVDFPVDDSPCLVDAVRGGLPGAPNITPTNLSGVLKGGEGSDAYLQYYRAAGGGTSMHFIAPIGIRARPAQGDQAFTGYFYQLGHLGEFTDPSGATTVSLPIGGWDAAQLKNFPKPWGTILRANNIADSTAANTAIGVDDYGAATTKGGYMSYCAIGNGTATITVQEADTNEDGSFANVTGLTTGELTFASDPPSCGIVQTAVGASIKRYVRWQVAFNSATAISFYLVFVRLTV